MSSRLVLKPMWANGFCTYRTTFKQMTPEDKSEVEQLADQAGYIRDDDVWTPPAGGRGVSEFFRLMRDAGFDLSFDDPEDAPFDLQRLHLEPATRRALERLAEFELYHLSGWTPVQAEGKLGNCYYYFRARGSYWRFQVGGNEKFTRSPRWWYEESWPSVTGFAAGYMSDEDAVGCILKAINLFRNGDNSRFKPEHPEYERTVLEGWAAGAISLQIASIRLGLSGSELIRRTETFGLEVPYTVEWELRAVEKRPNRRLALSKR